MTSIARISASEGRSLHMPMPMPRLSRTAAISSASARRRSKRSGPPYPCLRARPKMAARVQTKTRDFSPLSSTSTPLRPPFTAPTHPMTGSSAARPLRSLTGSAGTFNRPYRAAAPPFSHWTRARRSPGGYHGAGERLFCSSRALIWFSSFRRSPRSAAQAWRSPVRALHIRRYETDSSTPKDDVFTPPDVAVRGMLVARPSA
jgi:hypothetical protein